MAGAFLPQGPTYWVGEVAVHCAGAVGGTAYRIRNLKAVDGYLTWGTSESVVFAGAPTEGEPAENTLGFGPAKEVVTLPSDAWFIAGRGDSFEVTPGEGGV